MKRGSRCGVVQTATLCLMLSGCGGDGGDDNSVNDSNIFNGNVEIINVDEMSGNSENSEDNTTELSDNQRDCRRPDVFRVGLGDADASLVQFVESVPLPERHGLRRMIQVPNGNTAYVDSLVVSELGTVTVAHLAGGPDHTEMDLFDLDLDGGYRVIASAGSFGAATGRARVDIPLVPGVYCFFITDSFGVFGDNTELEIVYGFTAP